MHRPPREAWPLARVLSLVLMKTGHTGPPLEPRRRPRAGKSGDPRSRNADSSMGSWEDLEDAFLENFQGTYVQPLDVEDLSHIIQ